jgi:hypothetical protein
VLAVFVGVIAKALYGTWLAWRQHKARQRQRQRAAAATASGGGTKAD